jgi:DNA polymerase III subunit epsilon
VKFAVIDVETANPSLSSICQVGVVHFVEGEIYDSWKSFINPEDYFDPINVSIHGIGADEVRFAPKWADIYPKICSVIQDNIVVSHTAFDRVSVARACERSGLKSHEFRWLDSAKVVRRMWPMFSRRGYGLASVALQLGIQYRPHDALEDARCAGEVLLLAVAQSGLNIEQWCERVTRPIDSLARTNIVRNGNPNGPLYGEILVFTGALLMLRREAADVASAAGCEVDASVTKRTTLLVVGDQDLQKLAGHEKSAKHRKTGVLISNGQKIRILSESDFLRVVAH